MGTDIHFYVERRDGNSWVSCDTWEDAELYGGEPPRKTAPWRKHFYSGRNYDLFAILANVRNGRGFAGINTGDGFVPISEPRGLPGDLSPELRDYSDDFMEHTPSWLLVSEIMAFDWTQTTKKTGIVDAKNFCDWRALGRQHGEGPQEYRGGISGPGIEILDAEDMERRVVALESKIKDRKAIVEQMGDLHCRVEWKTTYYQAASDFLSDCLPRLWRLGSASDVRCVFWFDS